jgi:hypothetical protein
LSFFFDLVESKSIIGTLTANNFLLFESAEDLDSLREIYFVLSNIFDVL